MATAAALRARSTSGGDARASTCDDAYGLGVEDVVGLLLVLK
jgi:hypothetical protein